MICELCGNYLHRTCIKIPNDALNSRGNDINSYLCKYCMQADTIKLLGHCKIDSILCIKANFSGNFFLTKISLIYMKYF